MYCRIVDADSLIMDVEILERTNNPLAKKILVDQLRDLMNNSVSEKRYCSNEAFTTILAEVARKDPNALCVVNEIIASISSE